MSVNVGVTLVLDHGLFLCTWKPSCPPRQYHRIVSDAKNYAIGVAACSTAPFTPNLINRATPKSVACYRKRPFSHSNAGSTPVITKLRRDGRVSGNQSFILLTGLMGRGTSTTITGSALQPRSQRTSRTTGTWNSLSRLGKRMVLHLSRRDVTVVLDDCLGKSETDPLSCAADPADLLVAGRGIVNMAVFQMQGANHFKVSWDDCSTVPRSNVEKPSSPTSQTIRLGFASASLRVNSAAAKGRL